MMHCFVTSWKNKFLTFKVKKNNNNNNNNKKILMTTKHTENKTIF